MKYMLMIYEDQAPYASASQEEQGALFQRYMSFTSDLGKEGKMLAGDALQPSFKATTVRLKDGKRISTDGPYAESKEQLGITENFLFGLYKQVSAGPGDPAAKAAQKDEDFLKSIRSRDQKVKAPDQATPKKSFANTAAALAAFKERRDNTIAYVEKTKDQDLRIKIVPDFKMDAYQIFLLLAAHGQRHTDQINEVKATTGFPAK